MSEGVSKEALLYDQILHVIEDAGVNARTYYAYMYTHR